jgi:hypothetical protein
VNAPDAAQEAAEGYPSVWLFGIARDPAIAVNYAVSVGLFAEFELKDRPADFVQLNRIAAGSADSIPLAQQVSAGTHA